MISHLPSPRLRMESRYDKAQLAHGLNHTSHMGPLAKMKKEVNSYDRGQEDTFPL
jgi:hypothetical protein